MYKWAGGAGHEHWGLVVSGKPLLGFGSWNHHSWQGEPCDDFPDNKKQLYQRRTYFKFCKGFVKKLLPSVEFLTHVARHANSCDNLAREELHVIAIGEHEPWVGRMIFILWDKSQNISLTGKMFG